MEGGRVTEELAVVPPFEVLLSLACGAAEHGRVETGEGEDFRGAARSSVLRGGEGRKWRRPRSQDGDCEVRTRQGSL